MKVDISDILRVNGASMKLDFEETPPDREPTEGYLLNGKISFTGILTNVNDICTSTALKPPMKGNVTLPQ